jgi:hypothetical protein
MDDLLPITAILYKMMPAIFGIVLISVGGWVLTTWLRVKAGHPLDDAWSNAPYPRSDPETGERMKLLTQENAQLRAEIGALKDRLATVERIVTDGTCGLDREIEGLRGPAN